MVALKFRDPTTGAWMYVNSAGTQGPAGPVGPAGAGVVELTQVQYDGLATKVPTTLYVITDGADRTVLSGTVAPTAGVGINGDFYINSATWLVYGPKAAGAWPAGVSMIGTGGGGGTASVTELTQAAYDALAVKDPATLYVITDGADRTLLSGARAPTVTDGITGDFWINTALWQVSGPKTTVWPTAVSMLGTPAEAIEVGPTAPADTTWLWADTTATGTGGGGGGGTANVTELTQAAYDALGTKDPDTLYVITDGADRTLLTGTTVPATGTGIAGDFYINTTSWLIYGPKTTTWPTGVSIIGPAGAAGADGAAGATGDPGEPGGAVLAAFWSFATNTTAPPSAGQVRTDSATPTQVWVNETDTDGMSRIVGLGTVTSSHKIFMRAANGTSMDLQITGTPVDNGTYWTFPVSVISGAVTKGARTQLNFVVPSTIGIPAGGTTNQVLGKTSATDYAVSWRDDVSGGGAITDPELLAIQGLTSAADALPYFTGSGTASVTTLTSFARTLLDNTAGTQWRTDLGLIIGTDVAPARRIINPQTGTTYQPVLTDENKMVTLSNAAAITVTLPSSGTVGFTSGTEIDFLWLGAGQPTFVAGGGATLNGTPGLKLRAQYSACTAKLIAASTWVLIGDIAA